MKILQFTAVLAFGLMAPGAALAVTCPAIGVATDCTTVMTVDAGGNLTVAAGTGGSTYDGSDDQLVGFYNNSSQSISSIFLNGNGVNIFGFDGDGIGASPFNAPGNLMDTSDYGGPDSYFTGVSPNRTMGTVNFVTAIDPGGFTYFSLEEPFTVGQITGTPGTGAAPEPGTLILLGTGVLGLATQLRRKLMS